MHILVGEHKTIRRTPITFSRTTVMNPFQRHAKMQNLIQTRTPTLKTGLKSQICSSRCQCPLCAMSRLIEASDPVEVLPADGIRALGALSAEGRRLLLSIGDNGNDLPGSLEAAAASSGHPALRERADGGKRGVGRGA